MSDVTAGLLQREEQLKRVAISLMIRGVGSVLAFSVTYAYFRNLALSVAVMSAVWLAVLMFYDVPNVKSLIGRQGVFFRFDHPVLRKLLKLGLPLGWGAALASLNANIPRYFLQHYLGLADQGVYASLAYLVIVMGLVVYALSQSVTTRLARLFADGDLNQFVRLLTKLSMLGVLIAAVGIPGASCRAASAYLAVPPRICGSCWPAGTSYGHSRSHHDRGVCLLRHECSPSFPGTGSGVFRGDTYRSSGIGDSCPAVWPDRCGNSNAAFRSNDGTRRPEGDAYRT